MANNQQIAQLQADLATAIQAVTQLQAQVGVLQAGVPVGVPVGGQQHTTKIIADHVAGEGSLNLNANQTEKPLTVDVVNFLGKCKRKAKLSVGGKLYLDQFVNLLLIILDPVSSTALENHMKVYVAADETNITEELNTDYQDGNNHMVIAEFDRLFPRFQRYVIKYLFVESLQNTVRALYSHVVLKQDVTMMAPSAIATKLEELRQCSMGQNQTLRIPRQTVFTDLLAILRRSSPRHTQALALVYSVIKAIYTDVETTITGAVNAHAERDHSAKLGRVGKALDEQWHSVVGTSSFTNPIISGLVNNLNFEGQASGATTGQMSRELEQLLDATVIEGTVLPSSVNSINSNYTSRMDALSDQVSSLAVSVNNLVDGNVSDTDEEFSVNHAEVIDLEHGDVSVIASVTNVSEAGIIALVNRDRTDINDEHLTCFFCKQKGHRKSNCPKLTGNNNSSRNWKSPSRGRPNTRSYSDNRVAKPFSQVFGRNRSRGFTKLSPPRGRFKVFSKFRDRSTGGGTKIMNLETVQDVENLPDNAQIFVVDEDNTRPSMDDLSHFDWA
jgi:hypothetical protein